MVVDTVAVGPFFLTACLAELAPEVPLVNMESSGAVWARTRAGLRSLIPELRPPLLLRRVE
mgnify:CR=1 FL=1